MLNKVRIFFVLFYLIGAAGILIPATRNWFTILTPMALLMSSLALAIYHQSKSSNTMGLTFLFILLAGYFVEVIGVNTGIIFGEYKYGKTLGIKIFETPLLIGLNWLLLVYTSASLIQRTKLPRYAGAILASLLMVTYDLVLEPVAPKINMWEWANPVAPLQNYIAWGLIALVFHWLIARLKIPIRNPLDAVIFFCQIGFFLILFLL
jgi:bisanhydrobacterioruberin hydratase